MSEGRKESVSFIDAASAVAGSLFCGVTGFIICGTVVWALSRMFSAPAVVLGGAELVTAAGFIAVTGLILRHAMKLARSGWA